MSAGLAVCRWRRPTHRTNDELSRWLGIIQPTMKLRVDTPGPHQIAELREKVREVDRRVAGLDIGTQQGCARHPRASVDQHQLLDTLGMPGREELRHEAALGEADEAGARDAGGVHHGGDVPDALVERGQLSNRSEPPTPRLSNMSTVMCSASNSSTLR